MNSPWMKFYPSDWRADPALRMCSLAARALWMEMLCVMHEAQPRGSLLVNGQPVIDRQLAILSGAALRETQACLSELEAAGVFSREPSGTIFSRRMRRDDERAEQDKANGKAGGNPRLKRGVNPPDKAQKLEARSQKPEETASAVSGARALERDWQPSAESAKRLTDAGWKAEWLAIEAPKFALHAIGKGNKFASPEAADATFEVWCGRAVQFGEYTLRPGGGTGTEPASFTEIAVGTPEWNAWLAHYADARKRAYVSQMHEAAALGKPFAVPSRWPPGHQAQAA